MAEPILLTRRTSATETAALPSASRDHGEVSSVGEESRARRFETLFSSHLSAAYDFARWLARNDRNAEDIVQEACLRAFKSIDGFRGDNARAWLLAIVRNTYYTWFRKHEPETLAVPFDDDALSADGLESGEGPGSIERALQRADARRLVNEAIEQLPESFREVVVLRELEDFSYREIAAIAGIPLGTVMSRLARARKLLLEHLRLAVTVA
jgi:RNA polymerase sigma-70 factor (ECF subfamily)